MEAGMETQTITETTTQMPRFQMPKNVVISKSKQESVCPICKGSGWELYKVDARAVEDIYGGEDWANEFARKCTACSGRKEDADLTRVPETMTDADITKFDWNCYKTDTLQIKTIVDTFLNDFRTWQQNGKGLYFFSKEPGSGKTFLACCLAKSVMMKYNLRFRFITAPDYIDKVAEGYDIRKQGGFADPSQIFRECELLVLDDIGAQMSKEWHQTELFKLINYRMNNCLPTIYTANYEIGKLNIDERAKNRIINTSFAIHMPEESVRTKKANEKNNEFLSRILKKG